MRSIGAVGGSYALMLIGAALAIAASLILGLPPPLAGLGAAMGFVLALPLLGALHQRLDGSTPALLAAAGLTLLALKGFAGIG